MRMLARAHADLRFCKYGCCRPFRVYGKQHPKRVRRVQRAREKHLWVKEEQCAW